MYRNLKNIGLALFLVSMLFSFAYTTTMGVLLDRKIKPSTSSVIKPDYKQIRARHINSDITTSVAVYKDDAFEKGDTILTRYNTEERCLEVIYSNPESGLKVIVK